ncbi:Type I secretion system ATP-binding protein PrsD [bacterium YEK0313]|nr:Type I secretion system ATP-binding protein PrsD [bacterium YEK0313]
MQSETGRSHHAISTPGHTERLVAIVADYRRSLVAVGLFSGVMNLLALGGSIYMLQVYDRVLASRSIPTLVGLTLMLVFVLAIQCALDVIRQRVLVRIGAAIDRRLAPRVFDLTIWTALRQDLHHSALQSRRDLDAMRAFVSGLGPTTFFDLPWLPIFVGFCFALHFWVGIAAAVACVILFGLTLLTDRATRKPTGVAAREGTARAAMSESVRRNAETIVAMGMQEALLTRVLRTNDHFLRANETVSDQVNSYAAVSRIFRTLAQSAMLGLGAYLVLLGQMSGGAMIAASILLGRALAPIELAVAHWSGFTAARQAFARLRDAIAMLGQETVPLPLPLPKRMLTAEQLFVGPPGAPDSIVQGVSFSLLAGQALGVIGPSASGKSTLARALAGVWSPLRGSLRLDGAEISQWRPEIRGHFIGYLAQEIGLLDGTIAENIARFRTDADASEVVEAARVAGADEMIRRLPQGYETRIGEGGLALSGGQRQRIALARAVYGNPFLVILDEPNANLDADGEAAVAQAIRHIRDHGGIVIVIAHRPSAIKVVDVVAAMKEGRMVAFGPRDEVLRTVLAPGRGAPTR